MVKHLLISKSIHDQYRKDGLDDHPCLTDLAKVNVFVGPNNSGKSRLVRNILAYDHDYRPQPTQREKSDIDKIIQSGIFEDSTFESNKILELRKYFSAENGLNFDGFYWNSVLGTQTLYSHLEIAEALYFLIRMTYKNNFLSKPPKPQDWVRDLQMLFDFIKRRIDTSHTSKSDFSDVKRIYIPLLRGLRPLIRPEDMIHAFGPEANHQKVTITLSKLTENLFGSLEATAFKNLNDLYKRATERDYPELSRKCSIFTGLSIYWDIMDLLLGNDEQRKRVQSFEDFLSKNFFEGESLDLTPTKNKPGTLSVKIGDRLEQPIHALGDGIQSIITLLYPIYTQIGKNEYAMVGIEEPENSLHPGLQRVVLNALREFPNTQFFVTTHSNHFLETVEERDDTAIFRVENADYKLQEETRQYAVITGTSFGDFKTLQCLGVLNTSVFLSNCTIWVEGPTDRRIYRHYIHLYKRHHGVPEAELIEDKHYSFVEYGGSNISHLSVLDDDPNPINVDRLCGKMLLIADDDNATGAKMIRNSTLADKLNDRFLKLECKELENLCSPVVLNRIVTHYSLDGSQFDLNATWESYARKNIGSFIDQKINKLDYRLKMGKQRFADGKTVADKVRFCDLTIKYTNDWDDLSNEGKRVAEKIYKFIRRQNPESKSTT